MEELKKQIEAHAAERNFGAAAEAQRRLGDVLPRRHTAAESGALGKVGGAALGKGKLPVQGRGQGSAKVDLEKVRVLSSSKNAEVSARSQTKGASHKGAGLKGKGPAKSKLSVATEPFVAIYPGCISTKRVYQVMAYGACVHQLQAYVGLDTQPLVSVKQLERRPGKDELYYNDETAITTCLEPTDGRTTEAFRYDVHIVSKTLATKAFADNEPLGSFVDLALSVRIAVQKEIVSGDNVGAPYLLVSGVGAN